MDCNFKQVTKEEKEEQKRIADIAWDKKQAKNLKLKKKEWEKNFNKIWNKLKVGQQMAIVIAVDGEEYAKHMFFPTNHVSNLDSKGKKMFNDKGHPLKREWQTYEPRGALGLGINKIREYV